MRLYLEAFSKIAQAVPVVLEDALVGLVKLKPNSAFGDEQSLNIEIKEHLYPLLPHYMIPKDFIILETIPVLPSGRIDRRQLYLPHGVSIRKAHSVGSELGADSTQGEEGGVGTLNHQVKRNKTEESPSFASIFCCGSLSQVQRQVIEPGHLTPSV